MTGYEHARSRDYELAYWPDCFYFHRRFRFCFYYRMSVKAFKL